MSERSRNQWVPIGVGAVIAAILAGVCLLGTLHSNQPDRVGRGVPPTAPAVPVTSPPGSTPPAPTSVAPTPTRPAPSSPPPSPTLVPPSRPGSTALTLYLADLNAINPDIVGRHAPETMVSRGRSQCSSIGERRHTRAKLVELTNYRFTAPSHPDGFGSTVAERVLVVVHRHICPSYPLPAA